MFKKHLRRKKRRSFAALSYLSKSLCVQEANLAYHYYRDQHLCLALNAYGDSYQIFVAYSELSLSLHRLKAKKLAYDLLETLESLANGAGSLEASAYIAQKRALYIDYENGRLEDARDRIVFALSHFETQSQKLEYSDALIFQIYDDLCNARFAAIDLRLESMSDLVPTRSPLASILYSLKISAQYFSGEKDSLVNQIDLFLRRRSEVNARSESDSATLILMLIKNISLGEYKKLSENLLKLKSLIELSFALDAAPIFYCEYYLIWFCLGQEIYNKDRPRSLNALDKNSLFSASFSAALLKRLKNSQSSMSTLLKALCRDIEGDKASFADYDSALKLAKVQDNPFVEVLSYIWFGQKLVKAGKEHRKDYYKKALKIAESKGLEALSLVYSDLPIKKQFTHKDGPNLLSKIDKALFDYFDLVAGSSHMSFHFMELLKRILKCRQYISWIFKVKMFFLKATRQTL